MLRKDALVAGEMYHIYNRGAHKQKIFTSNADYRHFSLLLHLSNSKEPVRFNNLIRKYQGRSLLKVFEDEKIDERLVDILSYCLMPNHFHLIVRPREENGATVFMKKLATAYSMYFNTKYEHSGTLFQGRFKSSHIGTEAYFRYIFAYLHLNPLETFQPGWKEKRIINTAAAGNFLNAYSYSSFPDFSVPKNTRPERVILSLEQIPDFLNTQNDVEELLLWEAEDRPPLILQELYK